jgi:disulfide bond formation protein DsbB
MKRLSRANLVALAVPLALLGGAYGFQYFGGLVACEMCWWQRYAHFAALGLAVAALVLPVKKLFVALSGLALAAASAIGGYHAGVEYGWWKGLTECTTTVSFSNGGDPLAAIMAAPIIRCDVVQWKLMGISMAGFDFLISGAAALVVFALIARNKG